MLGPSIEYRQMIIRKRIRLEGARIFVFGDNVARKGHGGQAKEMRGEPNAIGVVTKFAPSYLSDAYLSDDRIDEWRSHFERDIRRIEQEKKAGKQIVFPAAGIGVGLASVDTRAPKIWKAMNKHLKDIGIQNPPQKWDNIDGQMGFINSIHALIQWSQDWIRGEGANKYGIRCRFYDPEVEISFSLRSLLPCC